MTVALVLAGAAVVFAVVFALALTRTAANADRRVGGEDRRTTVRTESPGRRREDLLRAEVHRLRRSLALAEVRLAELDATRAEIPELERSLKEAEASLAEATGRKAPG